MVDEPCDTMPAMEATERAPAMKPTAPAESTHTSTEKKWSNNTMVAEPVTNDEPLSAVDTQLDPTNVDQREAITASHPAYGHEQLGLFDTMIMELEENTARFEKVSVVRIVGAQHENKTLDAEKHPIETQNRKNKSMRNKRGSISTEIRGKVEEKKHNKSGNENDTSAKKPGHKRTPRKVKTRLSRVFLYTKATGKAFLGKVAALSKPTKKKSVTRGPSLAATTSTTDKSVTPKAATKKPAGAYKTAAKDSTAKTTSRLSKSKRKDTVLEDTTGTTEHASATNETDKKDNDQTEGFPSGAQTKTVDSITKTDSPPGSTEKIGEQSKESSENEKSNTFGSSLASKEKTRSVESEKTKCNEVTQEKDEQQAKKDDQNDTDAVSPPTSKSPQGHEVPTPIEEKEIVSTTSPDTSTPPEQPPVQSLVPPAEPTDCQPSATQTTSTTIQNAVASLFTGPNKFLTHRPTLIPRTPRPIAFNPNWTSKSKDWCLDPCGALVPTPFAGEKRKLLDDHYGSAARTRQQALKAAFDRKNNLRDGIGGTARSIAIGGGQRARKAGKIAGRWVKYPVRKKAAAKVVVGNAVRSVVQLGKKEKCGFVAAVSWRDVARETKRGGELRTVLKGLGEWAWRKEMREWTGAMDIDEVGGGAAEVDGGAMDVDEVGGGAAVVDDGAMEVDAMWAGFP